MKTLLRTFYARDTIIVAKDLLGKQLVRKVDHKVISGEIIETEAYRYEDDPASHSYVGKTERNQVMFGQVGISYVYFTYGMHYLMNVVAKSHKYKSGAVLIRALSPKLGIKTMKKNRKTNTILNLTNGPAKLAQALQITKKQYGEDLTKISSLFITEGNSVDKRKIISRPRIGIKKGTEMLWNFSLG
ncbi:MAG: DNA-3-methyladenine glycosylase [Thaumarchaeota archaeon]|nr:DNA-3-methyladenine glycosylase [Nitrososphaerota archaeon]